VKHRRRIPAALRTALVHAVLGLAGTAAHAHPAIAAAQVRAPDDSAGGRFADLIAAASRRHGVDEALVHSIVFIESSYDPEAVSPQGALGLMQLMPVTAERYGVGDALDPAQNIEGGVRFVRDLLDLFDGDVELAIAAYNAGANAVIRAGYRIPENPETLAFVPRVLGHYQELRTGAEIPVLPPFPGETAPAIAARDGATLPPKTDVSRADVLDAGLPLPEREERPIGIVSARRTSRWRLGRVRFSGAASSLFTSPPETRDSRENPRRARNRHQPGIQVGKPAARRTTSSKKIAK
jgi:hypothetical protein